MSYRPPSQSPVNIAEPPLARGDERGHRDGKVAEDRRVDPHFVDAIDVSASPLVTAGRLAACSGRARDSP
jgi:hypothetical protein